MGIKRRYVDDYIGGAEASGVICDANEVRNGFTSIIFPVSNVFHVHYEITACSFQNKIHLAQPRPLPSTDSERPVPSRQSPDIIMSLMFLIRIALAEHYIKTGLSNLAGSFNSSLVNLSKLILTVTPLLFPGL